MMKGKKRWIVLAVVALGIGAAVFAARSAASRPTPVQTGVAARMDLTETLACSGTLEPENGESVFADVSVRVTDVLKDKDDAVKKGEPVLALDLKDLENQLAQAKITLENQRLTVEKLKSSDPTQDTDALSVAVRQAEAALATERTALERARSDLATNKPLFEVGQISKTEYDRYVQAVEDCEARVRVSEMSLESARANLASAQKNNRQSGDSRETDVAMQENLLASQQLAVDDLEQTLASLRAAAVAPIDGVVTVMNAETGSLLSPGTPAYRVDDLSKLKVEAQVKEYDAKRLAVGQAVAISGDGIPEELTVSGKVSKISRTAETSVTTAGEEIVVPVTIEVDASPEVAAQLKAGLSATCDVTTDERKDAVAILYSMMMMDDDGTEWVFHVENGTLRKVVVKTGINANLNIEVTEGLSGGEELVVNPAKTLTEGMQVLATKK